MDFEDESTWLRHRVLRLWTILRFVKDARAESGLRELIAEAEQRLEQLEVRRATKALQEQTNKCLAHSNKSLAQSNKSCTGSKATNTSLYGIIHLTSLVKEPLMSKDKFTITHPDDWGHDRDRANAKRASRLLLERLEAVHPEGGERRCATDGSIASNQTCRFPTESDIPFSRCSG